MADKKFQDLLEQLYAENSTVNKELQLIRKREPSLIKRRDVLEEVIPKLEDLLSQGIQKEETIIPRVPRVSRFSFDVKNQKATRLPSPADKKKFSITITDEIIAAIALFLNKQPRKRASISEIYNYLEGHKLVPKPDTEKNPYYLKGFGKKLTSYNQNFFMGLGGGIYELFNLEKKESKPSVQPPPSNLQERPLPPMDWRTEQRLQKHRRV